MFCCLFFLDAKLRGLKCTRGAVASGVAPWRAVLSCRAGLCLDTFSGKRVEARGTHTRARHLNRHDTTRRHYTKGRDIDVKIEARLSER